MNIQDALPGVFRRSYPLLDPKTEMLSAMALLRFHEIDALPLSFDAKGKEGKVRAVFGYSSLARLVLLDPKAVRGYLTRPCQEASDPLGVVTARSSLSRLLDTFAETRFGFARIESRRGAGALVGLSDVLGLFGTGVVSSDLLLYDVGSPILSLPEDTTLRKALATMFEKRHRRVFFPGGREFISDRGVIGYLFSPEVLGALAKDTGDFLDVPISKIERATAKESDPGVPLADAASELRSERAGQCLVFDHKVVTPWDVVMKPWEAKKLKVAGPRSGTGGRR